MTNLYLYVKAKLLKIRRQITEIMGLPYGEEIMIVNRIVWAQSTSVTDGQTDGHD